MSKRFDQINRRTYFRTVALVSILCLSGSVIAAKEQEVPKTTSDGLNLVTQTKSRIVYMADDAELDNYTKVMLVDCAVAFAKNWQRDYNRQERDVSRRISDKDVQRIKDQLSAEFKKEFTKTLSDSGYAVVTEPAAGVLILRPAIINLVISAPNVNAPGISRTYVADPGQMTLYLELYDSVSSAILARIMDAKDAGRLAPRMANKVTNVAAADRMLESWAKELAGHLGDVTTAGTDK